MIEKETQRTLAVMAVIEDSVRHALKKPKHVSYFIKKDFLLAGFHKKRIYTHLKDLERGGFVIQLETFDIWDTPANRTGELIKRLENEDIFLKYLTQKKGTKINGKETMKLSGRRRWCLTPKGRKFAKNLCFFMSPADLSPTRRNRSSSVPCARP